MGRVTSPLTWTPAVISSLQPLSPMIAKGSHENWTPDPVPPLLRPPVSPSHSRGAHRACTDLPLPATCSALSLHSVPLFSHTAFLDGHQTCQVRAHLMGLGRCGGLLFPPQGALPAASPCIVNEVTLIILSKLHNRPKILSSASLMFSPEQFVLSNILHLLLFSLLSGFPL